jgi:hypothetical protein
LLSFLSSFTPFRRYKQIALNQFLHLQKQILAVQRIISCWKSWRRHKHSLAFQVLFEIFEFRVNSKKILEEKLYQQRLTQRKEKEIEDAMRIEELRKKYFHDLEKLQRERLMVPIFCSKTNSISTVISSTELFHWCDPHHETNNSFFNAKRYREWKDKFRIHHPAAPVGATVPATNRNGGISSLPSLSARIATNTS